MAEKSLLDSLVASLEMAQEKNQATHDDIEMIGLLKQMDERELLTSAMLPIMEIAVRRNLSPFEAACEIAAKLPKEKAGNMTNQAFDQAAPSQEAPPIGAVLANAGRSMKERIIR